MIRQFWNRYKVVIIFPALAFGSIAADYSYTRHSPKAALNLNQPTHTPINAMFGLNRQYLWSVVPLFGFGVGWFLDRKETERMTMFRDKSALYGRTLKEGEKPSWP
uniref:NADH dehydrogenase [ubiquinone] 1 beta subcomplex subunit 1 n=1 Tax=Anopheles melas TaxID=34690 RepID=A0A182TWS0_9DIPT